MSAGLPADMRRYGTSSLGVVMRPGIRIAVDVCSVRIGVAASDPSGLLASPVETLRRGSGDLERIGAIAAERAALEVLVGFPRSLSGREGPAAVQVREFAAALVARTPVPVRLVDERLSTRSATRDLRAAGIGGREQRTVVDQAAAVVFLQAALDAERSTGNPPGELIDAGGTPR